VRRQLEAQVEIYELTIQLLMQTSGSGKDYNKTAVSKILCTLDILHVACDAWNDAATYFSILFFLWVYVCLTTRRRSQGSSQEAGGIKFNWCYPEEESAKAVKTDSSRQWRELEKVT
jgi:hypothetical protein